jgi:predicted dehydrogenase
MMAQVVRVGLIGYGYWGPNYARVLTELPETELVAVCEADPERLAHARRRYPEAEACTKVAELLRNPDVEAVVISTSASTHFPLAQEVLESGRHVLVEKPLALTAEHCDQLNELAARQRKILMVAHTFIYNAGIRRMKEELRREEFGRVYYLHATRTNLGPIRGDVNAIWDLAPHDVSIFNYLLDEQPQWVSAVGTCVLENPREDVGFLTLGYRDGVIGNIHVSWADPNKVREVVAVGSRRRVVFNDLNDLERVRIYEKGVSVGERTAESYGEFKLLVRDGDIISPKVEPSEPLKNQCAEFAAAILHNRRPVTDGKFGAQVVRTLLAADASLRNAGRAVEVR